MPSIFLSIWHLSIRLTLTNLELVLTTSVQHRKFEYSCKFYQLNDDDFNFQNYEQILQAEDIISEVPLFQQEWEQSKINALHSEQTALFVATIKLSALDPLQLETTFQCFITYNVATVEQDFCDRLQLYLGAVQVKRTDLYSTNLAVTFGGRDTFKDLLVLTATSEFVSLEIVYQQVPNRGLDRFCVETLNFRLVSLVGGADMQQELPDILYYGDNGYWQATLIRLDELKSMRQKMKIYSRTGHQIIALLQAIYSEYEEKCSITLAEDTNTSMLEMKQALLEELDTKIEKPEDTRHILSRELKTDFIYSKLNTD